MLLFSYQQKDGTTAPERATVTQHRSCPLRPDPDFRSFESVNPRRQSSSDAVESSGALEVVKSFWASSGGGDLRPQASQICNSFLAFCVSADACEARGGEHSWGR